MAVGSLCKQITEDPTRSWREIIEESIARKGPLSPKKMQKLGIKLYRIYLSKFIENLVLEPHEMSALTDIKDFCGLNDSDTLNLHRSVGENAVERLTRLKMEDRILTDEERLQIEQFGALLNLDPSEIKRIQTSNALKLYQTAVADASADRRVSPDEVGELQKLGQNLGLSDTDMNEATIKQLNYFRLLWDVENGILPTINAPVVLQRKEVAHFAVPAHLLVSKLITTGYSAASSGYSIRIMRGVTYRYGQTRAHAIKKEVTLKYSGVLVVTSKRIVFSARQKGFVAPFRSLDNFEPFLDGIGLQKGSNYYLLECIEAELFAMILASASRKYFEEE